MNRGSTEIQEEREQERKSERGSMTVVESCQLGFGLTDRQTDGRTGRGTEAGRASRCGAGSGINTQTQAACRAVYTLYVLVRIQKRSVRVCGVCVCAH